jgi:hypothetical protein
MNESPNKRQELIETILGITSLILWATGVMVLFFGCSLARGQNPQLMTLLTWDAPSPTEHVSSWRIWRGIDHIHTVYDPSVCLEILALPDDKTTTLTVTAVNSAGESEHSDTVVIIPLVVQESVDMKDWRKVKTGYVVLKQQAFFRIAFPKP